MNNISLPGGIIVIIIAIYFGFYVNKKARRKTQERRDQLNNIRKAFLQNLIESKSKIHNRNESIPENNNTDFEPSN